MDINILVRPVYERQRTQLTNISNPDINHALCVPMGIHIGRVSLCTQACQTSTCSIIRKPTTIGTPTDKQASVTNVRSMISIESLPFVRQHILVGPVYERQRAQSTDISNPDVNHTLCMPMGIYTPGLGSLYAGIPSLDTPTIRKPPAIWNAN